METKTANATNNFMVRLWSKNHYGKKLKGTSNIYEGTITALDNKAATHFDTAAQMLTEMEVMYKEAEKTKEKK